MIPSPYLNTGVARIFQQWAKAKGCEATEWGMVWEEIPPPPPPGKEIQICV